ncbi:MAG: hypothetical protein U0517_00885 [Candidatus Andersenbacteria bacterium]
MGMLAIERREYERQRFVEKVVDRVHRLENDAYDRRLGFFLARDILDVLIPRTNVSWLGPIEDARGTEHAAEDMFNEIVAAARDFKRTDSEYFAVLELVMRRLFEPGITNITSNLRHDEMDPKLIPVLLDAPSRTTEVDVPQREMDQG